MNKELNIGDYVRTTDGEIGKIIECPEVLKENYGNWLWFETIDEQRPIIKESIIKSSPNIIDLIEVGDILKFKDEKHYQEVLAIDKEKLYLTEHIYMSGLQKYKKEIEKDIEWVITHEQLEQLEYKIGE